MKELRHRHIPLIFCTSKTRSEVQTLRRTVGNSDPFIAENGGVLVIPPDHSKPGVSGNASRTTTMVLGRPYEQTVRDLRTIARQSGLTVRGFHQMSDEEVARQTRLSLKDARQARKRECGEPFVFQDATASQIRTFTRLAHQQGYSLQRGGRFWHISAGCDKGLGMSILIGFYRAAWGADIRTIGLGDSGNDLPMLRLVDRPILMPKPDGSFDLEVTAVMPDIPRAPGPGSHAWGTVVLQAVRNAHPNGSRPLAKKLARKATSSA